MKNRKEQQHNLINESYELNEITFQEKVTLNELNKIDEVIIYKYAEQSGGMFESYIRAAKMFQVLSLFEKKIWDTSLRFKT